MAEAERLAYVALTRARSQLVLVWARATRQEGSPLVSWLFGADAVDSGQGADGHESRGLHGPMGGMEGAAAGSRVGTTGADVEAEQSRIPTGLNLR